MADKHTLEAIRVNELQQQVQQQHDELLKMNEQLEEADESQDLYLAMLSHNICLM